MYTSRKRLANAADKSELGQGSPLEFESSAYVRVRGRPSDSGHDDHFPTPTHQRFGDRD